MNDLPDFQDWLDRKGADPAGWPPAAQEATAALCAESPAAAKILHTAQSRSAALAALPDLSVPAHLWTKLLLIPAQQPRLNFHGLWQLLGPLGRTGSALGFAAAVALGVWLGGYDAGAAFLPGLEPLSIL